MCKSSNSPLSAAEHNNKPILAERFKTKMCQNFIRTGICPYEVRCMFAHGDHEMRTKEMNLRDKLVTEDAIKNFQRIRMIADRSMDRKKKRLAASTVESPLMPIANAAAAAAEGEEDASAKDSPHNRGRDKTPKASAFAELSTPTTTHKGITAEYSKPLPHPRGATPATVVERRSATPETPETIRSIRSPAVEGEAPTLLEGLGLAPPSLTTSPGARYRHDPYARVALTQACAATVVAFDSGIMTGGRSVVDKAAAPPARTRPLLVPLPLCAVALSDVHTSTIANTNVNEPTPSSTAHTLPPPGVSPLAFAMGRQYASLRVADVHGCEPRTPAAVVTIALLTPAAAAAAAAAVTTLIAPPPRSEAGPTVPTCAGYKTTYGAPSVVASHAECCSG